MMGQFRSRLLAIVSAASVVAMAQPSAAQAVRTSYTFFGSVDQDPNNPFTGSFTLSNQAGVYTLTAFNARYRSGVFTLANSGIQSGNDSVLFGGNTNGVNGIIYGTDDFYFTFKPSTMSLSDPLTYVGSTETSQLYRVSFNFALSAVPEPTTWVMTIAGFWLVGSAMRKRRLAVTVRYAA